MDAVAKLNFLIVANARVALGRSRNAFAKSSRAIDATATRR
jgi:hypothetical protein